MMLPDCYKLLVSSLQILKTKTAQAQIHGERRRKMVKAAEHVLTAEEMLAAQAQVFHLVMGYMGSMSLKCAIELNIPEIVATANGGRPVSFSNLLANLPIIPTTKAPFLRRIMRLLAQTGYFTVEKNEQDETLYSLTLLTQILLKNRPINLSSWVLGTLCPPHINTWHSLSRWLQSDKPGCTFEIEHGKSMWDLSSASPEINFLINEYMAGDTRITMKAVVDQCKEAFQGFTTLIDVGGGTGTSARAIAQAFPELKCTVFDLPHVVASIPENDLVGAIGGNMFEHIPKADTVFLKCILHDWTDENCVDILKKCKEAIPAEGGKVIIVDIVMKDREESAEIVTQLFWDVGMMAFTDGKEREEHEWKKIFTAAGFSRYKITPVGLRSLIEVFP